ncbi:putative ATPase [Anaplasma centrale str. Israel]|uniref:Putative ATPase n=1 Tax=Anaplasma centrale (strain Israel) TaxID=574556 RepID=D1AU17_ANACI|nr:cell division protein ZapE [Anaplasma centrale]ACZ49045.1 putative ATPase [Anaplasma centrale str. Israel]
MLAGGTEFDECMLARYHSMVNAREIVFDDLQFAALKELTKYDQIPPKWWELWRRPSSTAKKGVYIYGDVGRGKSLLANLFYEHSVIKKKKKVHFNTFMKDLHDLLHAMRVDNWQQGGHCIPLVVNTMLQGAELLYLDEVQVNDVFEAVVLHKIFSVLFSKNLVTVMTSNYPPHGLYEGGLRRELFLPAISLLEQRVQVVAMLGKRDYRTTHGRGACRYYVGEDADQELHARFAELIGSGKVEEVILTVGNRKVKTGKACNTVAWFGFDDLCGNKHPLWVADYKEIAKNFTTIFIEGIPVFDYYSQNEMQRFVVLVDELYERKMRIFCSLAADISELYVGPPSMGFRRAASRLAEMGSEMW